jgi:NADH-quinone oxidoreductase subunit E
LSVRRLADPHLQPKEFAFTAENRAWAEKQVKKYPEGRQASAVIPLLWRAQEQHDGWLPQKAIEHVAEFLGMAKIRVLEVATFYTMFLLSPVGKKAHVQVCGTTPCRLRGADALFEVCARRIHPEPHHVSADGDFSWEEVECLGACVNAPMVLIWNVKPGPQIDRHFSAPLGGASTLTDPSLYARPSGGDNAGPALTDGDAKKAGTPANVRETPAGQPST